MKVSKSHLKYMKVVGDKVAEIVGEHPEQTIQEQWMKWLDEGEFTPERYTEFLDWKDEWLKLNPLD